MSERPGLARIHKAPNPHLYCDIYTCRRLGAWIIEHREGMFGTDHLVLCQECAEAMLRELPEELRRFATSNELPPEEPEESVVDLLRKVMATSEIQAMAKGEPVTDTAKAAIDSLLDVLVGAMDGPPEDKPFACDVCGKRFKTANALRGHMASHRGKR